MILNETKIVDRLMHYLNIYKYYVEKIGRQFYGLYFELDKTTLELRNTGIYSDKTVFFLTSTYKIILDGFDWNEETIKLEVNRQIKLLKINIKKEEISKDFEC